MKFFLYTLLVFGLSIQLYAQGEKHKDIKFGIVTGSGVCFVLPETTYFTSDGVGNDLTVGANLNFGINPSLAFCTGVEFDFNTLKFRPGSTDHVYYRYNDKTILQLNDLIDFVGNSTKFDIISRTQKPVYLSIPMMLMGRTNYFGSLRYFGKFGLRNSILLKSKTTDEGFNNLSTSLTPIENMKSSRDLFLFKSSVGIAGGTEWNFAGNTSLMFELGYYYGLTPLFWSVKNDDYKSLFVQTVTGERYITNQAKHNQLMLKVALIF